MRNLLSDRAFQAGLRGGLAVLLLAGTVLLIMRAWVLVQPLIVAVVLATALWPWVTLISSRKIGPRHWRLPRLVATLLIFGATFLVAGTIIWVTLAALVPQFNQLLERYPQQTAGIREYLEPFQSGDIARGAQKVAEDVVEDVVKDPSSTGTAAAGTEPAAPGTGATSVRVGQLALTLFGGLATLGLVLLFTFFLLLQGDRFAQGLILLLPREHRPHVRSLAIQIRDRMSRWVLAQAVYGLLSGLIVSVAMWAFQVPSPWIYGVLATLLAVLPGIGPAVATIPAIVAVVELSAWQPIGIGIFAIIFNVIDGTMISPKIFGDVMRLPMFVTLLALLLGALLMGVWGALIATPVAVALQMIIRDHLGRTPTPGPA